MKLYIAIHEDFPDYMAPTLVAHTILNAHNKFLSIPIYNEWFKTSFKKCVVRVNQKELDKIGLLYFTHLGHENNTLDGRDSCAIPLPCHNDNLPNVLKFAKLWKPI